MKEGPSGSAIRSLIPSRRERLYFKAQTRVLPDANEEAFYA